MGTRFANWNKTLYSTGGAYRLAPICHSTMEIALNLCLQVVLVVALDQTYKMLCSIFPIAENFDQQNVSKAIVNTERSRSAMLNFTSVQVAGLPTSIIRTLVTTMS